MNQIVLRTLDLMLCRLRGLPFHALGMPPRAVQEEFSGGFILTGSALRESDCNSILGYNMIMKIIILLSFSMVTNYFTMPIVSGMHFSCGFHSKMLKTTPWCPVYNDFCIINTI